MQWLYEVRLRILQTTATDMQNRMTEIWALREAVRTFEATPRGPEPIRPAVVAPPAPVDITRF